MSIAFTGNERLLRKFERKVIRFVMSMNNGPNPQPSSVPKWLEEIFGVDFFHTVYCVEFRTKPADRESLKLLDEFSNLRGLFVYTKEELSKETCMRIARFRSLDYLYLGIPPIDAENFKELMVLKNIKTLYLTTTINDDVLKYVAEFDALEHLHINNKNISEDGIYQLHSLKHLTFINLFGKYDVSSELQEKMKGVGIKDGSFSRWKHSGGRPTRAPAMRKTAADIEKTPKPVPQAFSFEE
jgi:hypothetical protein